MQYFIPADNMGSPPIPRTTVLNQLPVIGYECLNPTETALLPHEINLIDTGLTIQFPNAHVLKIEIYSALFSSQKNLKGFSKTLSHHKIRLFSF